MVSLTNEIFHETYYPLTKSTAPLSVSWVSSWFLVVVSLGFSWLPCLPLVGVLYLCRLSISFMRSSGFYIGWFSWLPIRRNGITAWVFGQVKVVGNRSVITHPKVPREYGVKNLLIRVVFWGVAIPTD